MGSEILQYEKEKNVLRLYSSLKYPPSFRAEIRNDRKSGATSRDERCLQRDVCIGNPKKGEDLSRALTHTACQALVLWYQQERSNKIDDEKDERKPKDVPQQP